jgi:hypothetical protein
MESKGAIRAEATIQRAVRAESEAGALWGVVRSALETTTADTPGYLSRDMMEAGRG